MVFSPRSNQSPYTDMAIHHTINKLFRLSNFVFIVRVKYAECEAFMEYLYARRRKDFPIKT